MFFKQKGERDNENYQKILPSLSINILEIIFDITYILHKLFILLSSFLMKLIIKGFDSLIIALHA
jgi:hypothetical protein